MAAYHGGKQRIVIKIAETIHDISTEIEEEIGFRFKGYCEPFCGMLGVYQHIPELFSDHRPKLKYRAGDMNKSLVKMWQELQRGWKPPEKCSKERFERLKYDGKSSAEKGFVGHACTYRGVYFDGFFAHKPSKTRHNAKRAVEIAREVEEVKFSAGPYTQFSNLKGFVIYCDPPYADGNQRYYEGIGYTNRLNFDTKAFWKWCDKMAEDNLVFVSEYKAPRRTELIERYGEKEKLYLV